MITKKCQYPKCKGIFETRYPRLEKYCPGHKYLAYKINRRKYSRRYYRAKFYRSRYKQLKDLMEADQLLRTQNKNAILNLYQVAALLKNHPKTIWKYCLLGRLKYVKDKESVALISITDLYNFLDIQYSKAAREKKEVRYLLLSKIAGRGICLKCRH